ncbi:hypothetical protein RV18_GL002731 [Enterococcus termitis]|nr:hypothetical protein RV18_GL002731 [Enterococcus termitis]
MNALSKNLASGKEATSQLKSGSQRVVSAVDGHTLAGAAYTAGKGLFSDLIIPTITRVTTAIDTIEQELQKYTTADSSISNEGYLDEDSLSQQIAIKKAMKASVDATSYFVKYQTMRNPVASLLDALFDAQRNLNQISERFQQDIDELTKKLQKLHDFSSQTNGLFSTSLSDMKLAMQGILILNNTTINSDGTYKLPAGTDKSWFTELKSNSDLERNAYDSALDELLAYDSDGTIKDVDEAKLQEWLKLFVQGKLTPAQAEALKTALLTLPGYLDKMSNAEGITNEALKKLAELQDIVGGGWSAFGFSYDEEGKHFYTKQDSLQSLFGFADIYDEAGPLLGMDLDTEVIQFFHNGKEYRFQVWKGTYGGGTMVGGEQGWYVYNPNDVVQNMQNSFADTLGQSDWVPVAAPEDRIRMVNSLYNETTNRKITDPNDTNKYAPEGAYWNLNTTADYPGYTKSNIYTKGELYIDDANLRNETFQQLKANGSFTNVQIIRNKVIYTWKD